MSNIAFLSNVLEKAAVNRLMDHIRVNGLAEFQSAYKAQHSTATALLRVQHDITSALDSNKGVVFVMLDLSAAFDTIDQEQLLHLMTVEFGITDEALSCGEASQ